MVSQNEQQQLFFLHRDGEQHGPFPEAAIRAMALQGQLREGDLAWSEEMAEWQNAAQLFPSPTGTSMEAPAKVTRGMRPNGKLLVAAGALALLVFAAGVMLFGSLGLSGSAAASGNEQPTATSSPSPSPSPAAAAVQPEPVPSAPPVVKGFYLGMPMSEAEEILNNTLRSEVDLFCVRAEAFEILARQKALLKAQTETGIKMTARQLFGEQTPWEYKPISKLFVDKANDGRRYKLTHDKSENRTIQSNIGGLPVAVFADSALKVNSIWITPKFTPLLFNTANVTPAEFAKQFAQGYKFPELAPAKDGWRYVSEHGWGIQVYDDYGIRMFYVPKSEFN